MKYELHKKIQRSDINYIDQIKRLESLQQDLVNSVNDGSPHKNLTQLLMPIDEELNNIKNNHSLVVMNLYCQKNVCKN